MIPEFTIDQDDEINAVWKWKTGSIEFLVKTSSNRLRTVPIEHLINPDKEIMHKQQFSFFP